MQPLNRARQEPLHLAPKVAGQLTVTHWKKASLQVFATVQMPGPFCANASMHRTATATTTARMIEARLSKGTISERLSQHRNAPMLSTALGAPERTPMPKLTRRSLVAGSAVA